MVLKTLILLTAISTLSGCIAYTPVKFVADKVCEASDAKKQVLAEEFDKATFPHKLRVQCYQPSTCDTE